MFFYVFYLQINVFIIYGFFLNTVYIHTMEIVKEGVKKLC